MSTPIQPSEPDEAEEHQIARTTAARRLAVGLLAISVVLMLVVATLGVVLIRSSQKANTSTLDSARDAAESAKRSVTLIEDCVTPQGECAKRGQKQTAKAIGDIGQAQLIMLSCAFTVDRPGMTAEEFLAALQPCVARMVAASGGAD